MESKFDYITLTLKSDTKTLDDALDILSNDLVLGDLIDKMVYKGGAGFFDYHLTYENIEFFLSTPERFQTQGICLKISSQGLDYFNKYLGSYNLTLRQWLGRWRSLCFEDYITKSTRIDYALDDIVHKDECPTITMSHVIRAVNNGEVCKKARTIDILCGSEISVRERIKYCQGEPIRGLTVYFGVRQSGTLVRFYDKLAEQIQRKGEVPKDVTHWTRCEVEFHGDSAMCILNAFIDMSEEEFNLHMRGVVNNQCRFITRNNDNISRCPSKRWWTAFLNGCTERFKLPHKKPARSALARAERGLRQYVPTIFTLYQEIGLEGIYCFFETEVNRLKVMKKDIFKPEIAENLREDIRDYEEMTSVTHYTYNTPCEYKYGFENKVFSDRAVYRYVSLSHDKLLHELFMSGQEVLF